MHTYKVHHKGQVTVVEFSFLEVIQFCKRASKRHGGVFTVWPTDPASLSFRVCGDGFLGFIRPEGKADN